VSEWLASGLRRDVCIRLYGDECRRQRLKSAIESRYDRRIEPRRFREALSALLESGHVAVRTEGIADVYALTEAGERGVETQYAWLRERVSGAEDSG
jgi:DNA-binding PadR family transcriptional regulator